MGLQEQIAAYVNLRLKIDELTGQLDILSANILPVLLASDIPSVTVSHWKVTAVKGQEPGLMTDYKTLASVLKELVSNEDWEAAVSLAQRPSKGRKAYLRISGSLRK